MGGQDDGATAHDHLRASDADRQQVADRLRRALDEGRLTLLEYDERLGAAYGAPTYGELAKVTNDLPSATDPVLPAAVAPAGPAPVAQVVPAAEPGRARRYLAQQGRAWLGGAVITNGIWAATSGFDVHSYWPGTVLPIWAAAIVGGLISGSHLKGDGERHRPHLDRHRTRLDRHQERTERRRRPPT